MRGRKGESCVIFLIEGDVLSILRSNKQFCSPNFIHFKSQRYSVRKSIKIHVKFLTVRRFINKPGMQSVYVEIFPNQLEMLQKGGDDVYKI